MLLLQLHQQQQLLPINIINSTNHHLQHAKLRILLQHLTSHAAYERNGGPLWGPPPKRPAAKRPCIDYGHIYRVLLYTQADTSSSSGSNTAAVDYQLRTDYMYICCCCTYSYYGQFARTLLGTATYVRITAAARSSSSGSRSSNPLNCIIMLVFT